MLFILELSTRFDPSTNEENGFDCARKALDLESPCPEKIGDSKAEVETNPLAIVEFGRVFQSDSAAFQISSARASVLEYSLIKDEWRWDIDGKMARSRLLACVICGAWSLPVTTQSTM
ncbi:hypothetical protein IV203_006453 [Nitzschia inconspicua]|uniref:Uncharacterized protein n=1 Tax=Nitzschia inconspicua TaxID=303405 RepID=A0A9K3PCJ5_9STRA|nr:hypothetical protein IV203_006453 [Nitzschia inconspicua]